MNKLEGTVKLQCLESNSQYIWRRVKLCLQQSASILTIDDPQAGSSHFSLTGVKLAKEWSYSSAIAGYGFDLYWTSGRIMSFLVDDLTSCKTWVAALNTTIDGAKFKSLEDRPLLFPESCQDQHSSNQTVPPNASHTSVPSEQTANTEVLSPAKPALGTSGKSKIIDGSADEYKSDTSIIPSKYTSDSQQKKLSPSKDRYPNYLEGRLSEEILMRARNEGSTIPETLSLSEPVREEENGDGTEATSSSIYIEAMKSLFSNAKKEIMKTDKEIDSFEEMKTKPRPTEAINRVLPKSSSMLSSHLTVTSNFEGEDIRERYEETIRSLTREVALLKGKRNDDARELEEHILEASKENSSFYEASVRALRLQHGRELNALQDQLMEERSSHLQALENEKLVNKRLQHDLEGFRQQYSAAELALANLRDKLSQVTKSWEQEQSNWGREKKKLQHEFEERVKLLEVEKERGLEEVRRQLHVQTQKIQTKYEESLNRLRSDEMELLSEQWESEKMRSIVELHKRSQKEVEKVRTEERKLAAVEIENIRAAYHTRDRQTAIDLVELEKLHAIRVKKVEDDLEKERSNANLMKKELSNSLRQIEKKAETSDNHKQELEKKLLENIKAYEDLQRTYHNALRDMEEIRGKCRAEKERARQSLTDLRLLQAEIIELKRQNTETSSSAMQWRKIVSEQEKMVLQSNKSTIIKGEELTFAEHELRRLKEENIELRRSLQSAERLIFGIPQTLSP